MARVFLWGALAAFLLNVGPALGAVSSSRSGMKSRSQTQSRTDDQDRERDGARRRTRFEQADCRSQKQEPRPGYSRRNALQRPAMYGEKTHSSACRCSPCSSRSAGRRGNTTVVVIDNGGGDAVVVLTDGRRRNDRGYGRSPSNEYGASYGLSRDAGAYSPTFNFRRAGSSSRLRRHADPDCRDPGTVLASSGNLYVQVRADGRLTIRSR